jgi:hypothetical protein
MRINRTGRNRLVFLTPRYAIKVPRPSSWANFLYGLLNNLNEARDSHLGGRCPVIASFPLGLAIVMPRAEILTQHEFGAFDYHNFCREHRIKAECKPDSFGRLGGEVVAVDYGW